MAGHSSSPHTAARRTEMISVASLLNPVSPSASPKDLTPVQAKKEADGVMTLASTPKKTLARGSALTQETPRFQPFNVQDAVVEADLKKFKVDSISQIRENPRHIPYRSDKKDFQQKTGRDAFEAYHYTFRMPDDDPRKEPHAIMWDYNYGLVRITAFFKSLRLNKKTMPAKVMNANPGLREISHSITGGAIAAQGYWMPFDAAKAIAAAYCFEIRHILTPMFGPDFPAMCLDPADPAFMKAAIDPEIVRQCTEEAAAQQIQAFSRPVSEAPQTASRRTTAATRTPGSIRSNPFDDADVSGTDDGSDAGTRFDIKGPWNPVNVPRSNGPDEYQVPTPERTPDLMEPRSHKRQGVQRARKRLARKDSQDLDSDTPSPDPIRKRKKKVEHVAEPVSMPSEDPSPGEMIAARALLELHHRDREMAQRVASMPRSASY